MQNISEGKSIAPDRDAPSSAAAEQSPAPAAPSVPISGRFARYTSPFLQLLLPILSVRYIPLAVEDINPGNFLVKPDPSKLDDGITHNPKFKPYEKPSFGRYVSRNFAALFMGALAEVIIGMYTKRTYDDIRTVYAEAVGYELDKKPEAVGWRDIFFNSKNAALNVTKNALIKRTLMRAGAGASFFFPWHVFRDWGKVKSQPKFDANANAGVGIMAGYLSLDGFSRKQSFFEAEQNMVDTSINHVDSNVGHIHPNNIQSLLLLQRHHIDPRYQWPSLNSPEGQNQAILAERIAALMNETYNNVPKTEQANFTIGKFNYLVGFGLLDDFPSSLAFVELANKSSDMKEVKTAAAAIKGGQDPQAVFKSFGIDLKNPVEKNAAPPMIHSETMAKSFAARVQQAAEKMPQAARTHQDFAAQAHTADRIMPS